MPQRTGGTKAGVEIRTIHWRQQRDKKQKGTPTVLMTEGTRQASRTSVSWSWLVLTWWRFFLLCKWLEMV